MIAKVNDESKSYLSLLDAFDMENYGLFNQKFTSLFHEYSVPDALNTLNFINN